jgi:YggT family protein
MYIIGYLLMAIAKVLDVVMNIFLFIVIARAVLSWVSPDPFNPIVRFINNVTEPVLHPIRTRLPLHFGGIDLSPIVVFLGIIFIRTFVVNTLMQMSDSLL